jgi:putative hydrolase of the HAD superfamily
MPPKSALPAPADFRPCDRMGVRSGQHALPAPHRSFLADRQENDAICARAARSRSRRARAIQKKYYREHGTTLQGLMLHHGIDPMTFSRRCTTSTIPGSSPIPNWARRSGRCRAASSSFTNGDTPHAERTARALGILDHFDEIFDIIAADLKPKPAPETYDRFLARHGVHKDKAAMFEDLPRNLLAPHRWECAPC